MKPGLQLQIGQHLTMTPQLQQAIRLLQLSTLELQQEVQIQLETNPMLEVAEEGDEHWDDNTPASANEEPALDLDAASRLMDVQHSSSDGDSNQESYDNDSGHEGSDDLQPMDMSANDAIPEELGVDSAWEDIYQSSGTGSGSGSDDDGNPLETRNGTQETLFDHLLWQLNLTLFSDTDRMIALAIIEAIEPDGYVRLSHSDIREATVNALLDHGAPADIDIEDDEIDAVLHRVQQFDPPGIAARHLGECLAIQLRQMPENMPSRALALRLVNDFLQQLGSRDYALIMRRCQVDEERLKAAIRLIQTLNPQPGHSIGSSNTEYVTPDVIVRRAEGRWRVELNPEVAPRLRINHGYSSLIRRADNSDDNNFLRNQLAEARWFLKSLQSRHETLLKVTSCIVEHQLGFFEHGPEYMKPLVLADIADAVGMHESTISRVTTQKYVHTPRGIYELKYFFSSHVSTSAGGECSSTAIRAKIRKLIDAEDPKKPLSDSRIADILIKEGIEVARRTIAKYRESLNIPPSSERKRLV